MNPVLKMMGGQQAPPGPMGNFMQMRQQLMQFAQNYQGNPRQEVEKLLQSGRMSQQQLDQLQAFARQFM